MSGWVQEPLAGVIDGINKVFTVSVEPIDNSIFVVYGGLPLERVMSTTPAGQQYSRTGNSITVGTPPDPSTRRPWARYFTDEAPPTFQAKQHGVIETWGDLADALVVFTPKAGQFIDAWATLADARTARRTLFVSLVDSAANLADQIALSRLSGNNFTDPWQTLTDQVAARYNTLLTLSESWGNLADAFTEMHFPPFVFPDTWRTLADQLATFRAYRVAYTDVWNNLTETFNATAGNKFTDNANFWAEANNLILGEYWATISDTSGTVADKTLTRVNEHKVGFTDNMGRLADTVARS